MSARFANQGGDGRSDGSSNGGDVGRATSMAAGVCSSSLFKSFFSLEKSFRQWPIGEGVAELFNGCVDVTRLSEPQYICQRIAFS